MTKSATFLTAKSHSIGMGHFNRCLNLSEFAKIKGFEVQFYVFTDNLKNNSFYFNYLPFNDILNDPRDDIFNNSLEILIVDLSFPKFMLSNYNVNKWLNFFRNKSKTLIIIDGLGENSICKKYNSFIKQCESLFLGLKGSTKIKISN